MNNKQNTAATKVAVATTLDDLRVADHFRSRFGVNAYAEAVKALFPNRAETKRVLSLLK